MASDKTRCRPISVEITVISAHGLKNPTLNALFSRRLKPFATLTAAPSTSPVQVHATSVDPRGGSSPTWNEKFRLSVDPAFFADVRSSVHLAVRARPLGGGEALLGWCQIPAGDILSPAAPAGPVGFLSYRLRDRDGTRGHGTVNVAVRVAVEEGWAGSVATRASRADAWPTVIGWPVASACG
ncbi:BON1-associated protein 2-like [Rhodamnia argentea]|uniref:BON1-associated protein 2-like n=1 Tax=Rhodamnia argentea TaxID=178133 RepID=A0A8B8N8D1_9MYRT|nr:BON1-associated protein 2-like [Rhodamnia argentea]